MKSLGIKKIFAVILSSVMCFCCMVGNGIIVGAEEKALLTEAITLDLPYDYVNARFIDDEGNIYCEVFDLVSRSVVKNQHIVKIDCTGKVLASVEGSATKIKQFGEDIYVLTENYDSATFMPKGMQCKVYSKSLKLKNSYDLSFARSCQYADINSKSVCYLSGNSRIYVCDLDGKNKKLVYNLNKGKLAGTFCQGVALTEDYIGFIAEKYENSERITYCGAINLESKKVQFSKQPMLDIPTAFYDKLAWSSNSTGGASLFSSSKQVVVYEDGKFRTVKTKSKKEVAFSINVDSDGAVITWASGNSDDENYFRIYRNGKVKQIKRPHGVNYVTSVANKGIIAYSYSEKSDGKNYVKVMLIPY